MLSDADFSFRNVDLLEEWASACGYFIAFLPIFYKTHTMSSINYQTPRPEVNGTRTKVLLSSASSLASSLLSPFSLSPGHNQRSLRYSLGQQPWLLFSLHLSLVLERYPQELGLEVFTDA